MALFDRSLGWLARVLMMTGLVVGVVIPPMLLRLINQLNQCPNTTTWQVLLVISYLLVFAILAVTANA